MDKSLITWLDDFRKINARPLKILHIGNIANNAYNNAKLLHEVGIDSDVICYDYYHIMGCPEWEDADCDVSGIDNFYPAWKKYPINNFIRPRWFAQGPMNLCIDYLLAKEKHDISEESLWVQLGFFNRTQRWSSGLFVAPLCREILLLKAKRSIKSILPRFLIKQVRQTNAILLLKAKRSIKSILPTFLIKQVRQTNAIFSFWGKGERGASGNGDEHFSDNDNLTKCCKRLINEFVRNFPDRKDKFLLKDITISPILFKKWIELLRGYDAVIAYSTDGIYPLLARVPYIAFEHGTIRNIPYELTPQGRMCSLVYRMANHTLVTNIDCVESAEYLVGEKYTLINHPFDENHSVDITGVTELRSSLLKELDCSFLLFFPTRHDWVQGSGYADKSNDIFIKAFATLRGKGKRVGMVCCDWGKNVADSKELLANMGCEEYVKWVDPMAVIAFERMCKASDCVVDQFKLGSFGGVLFKAMATGAPVLTYLDLAVLGDVYLEPPPVINCKNSNEIVRAMIPYIDNPTLLEGLRISSKKWIKEFHGKEETVRKQLAIIRTVVKSQ